MAVRMEPSAVGRKASLCSLPRRRVPAKPDPISKPLVAGKDITALARSASNLSNTGIPNPAGQWRATQPTTPPRESPSWPMALILVIMDSATAKSGHRTMVASTWGVVTAKGSTWAAMSCTCSTQPTTSMLWT